jgi:hypothetical protein
VSDQQAEQTKAGSVGAEPVVTPLAPARSEMDASMPAINVLESPRISPDHESPKPDEIKPDEPKANERKADERKADAPQIEAVKAPSAKPSLLAVETPKLATADAVTPKMTTRLDSIGAEAPKINVPGRLLIMSAANDGARAEAAAATIQRAAALSAKATRPADASTRTGAPQAAAGAAKPDDKPESKSEFRPEQADAMRGGFTPTGRRGLPAAAAMLALALLAGGIGGALATAAFLHASGGQPVAATTAGDSDLAASVARIDADVANLKASLDQTNQTSLVELNKTAERLDKVEKAQNDLTAKTTARSGEPKSGELAKLSEAVERLRAAQASAQGSGRETTGSVASQAQANTSQANSSQTKSSQSMASAASGAGVPTANRTAADRSDDNGQLKVLDGWVLRDVGRGGALIEGRQGLFEVYAGDPVPGLGKVDAIRRQDGRWVVVTTKGLIVSR